MNRQPILSGRSSHRTNPVRHPVRLARIPGRTHSPEITVPINAATRVTDLVDAGGLKGARVELSRTESLVPVLATCIRAVAIPCIPVQAGPLPLVLIPTGDETAEIGLQRLHPLWVRARILSLRPQN